MFDTHCRCLSCRREWGLPGRAESPDRCLFCGSRVIVAKIHEVDGAGRRPPRTEEPQESVPAR